VDDGKSTLIGRLLFDSKQIFRDQLDAIERTSMERGDGYVDLALLTDGLRAEREQGITIDVAYRYFSTPKRKFIIADTPGHVLYTRNMVTGASTADVAIVLVDARNGVVEQSRRHAFIASLLGVPHLVVCVNKMDLVGYEEDAFERIADDFRDFSAKLEISDVEFIPMSALHGDNVVDRSLKMPWYGGPPLLYHLEHVHIASDRNLIDSRFPVQYVLRPRGGEGELHDYRGYAGQVAGGILRPGDDVVVLPSGVRSRIEKIHRYDEDVEEAWPPMSVALTLHDDIDVSRGDMICRPQNRPAVASSVEALVCWMSERPLEPGGRYAIKHTTRSARATVRELRYRIDVNELHRDRAAERLELNEIGRVTLRTSTPLVFDAYRRNRSTGSFVLIDETTNDTVGAGMIIGVATAAPETTGETGAVERSPNVVWQRGRLTRDERWTALGQRGATVWITGLPASGKSTIATALEERLVRLGVPAYLLDGDNLRHGLNGDLGFDHAARVENIRRTAHVARLLADSGAVALVSLVSPYTADRRRARSLHEELGLEFVETWVNTPLEECERRDPKGFYAKARSGEIESFTGVSDPYEPPERPDIEILGAEEDPIVAAERIIEALRGLGVVPD
jgi:bifunctional enzyme CysN/CysC